MNKTEAQAAIHQAAKTAIAQKDQPLSVPFGTQISIEQRVSGGPLPPPEVLKRYNDAVPSGAERIMAMAEKEQKHVHRLQFASYVLTFVGEILGWSIVALAMWGAFTLVMKDKRLEGAFSFFSGLSLLAAGYYERRKTRKETQQQVQANPQHKG